MKRILLLLCVLFSASVAPTEGWEFDLSLFQEQRELAEVTVVTDGKVLMSIVCSVRVFTGNTSSFAFTCKENSPLF